MWRKSERGGKIEGRETEGEIEGGLGSQANIKRFRMRFEKEIDTEKGV